MILPSDFGYIDSKLLKQGKKLLQFPFDKLAEWIAHKYDVTVLNVYYDIVAPNSLHRLNVVVEFEKDLAPFNDRGNYNQQAQNDIADEFALIVNSYNATTNQLHKLDYQQGGVLVTFSAFEGIAAIEANWNIPKDIIKAYKQYVWEDFNIWEVLQEFAGVVFFFYTDKDLEKSVTNGIREQLINTWWETIKQYDEFGYLSQGTVDVQFDSRENFEENYEGNWFWYSRR